MIATRDWFEGRWAVQRVILSVPERVVGEFWGEAVFAPDAEGLICRESGVLRYEGHDYNSGRVLLWRFPGAGRVEVRFEDDRPFHEFDPKIGEAEHLCEPDIYRVTYRFEPALWESRWEVHGPQKDYVMETRYRRHEAQR